MHTRRQKPTHIHKLTHIHDTRIHKLFAIAPMIPLTNLICRTYRYIQVQAHTFIQDMHSHTFTRYTQTVPYTYKHLYLHHINTNIYKHTDTQAHTHTYCTNKYKLLTTVPPKSSTHHVYPPPQPLLPKSRLKYQIKISPRYRVIYYTSI